MLVCCVAWMGWISFWWLFSLGTVSVCRSLLLHFFSFLLFALSPPHPLSISLFLLFFLFLPSPLLLLFCFLDLSIYLCTIFHSAASELKVANMVGCMYVYTAAYWFAVLFCFIISFSFLCFFISNFLAYRRNINTSTCVGVRGSVKGSEKEKWPNNKTVSSRNIKQKESLEKPHWFLDKQNCYTWTCI